MLFVDEVDGAEATKVVGTVGIVGVDGGITGDDSITESFLVTLSTPFSSLLSSASVETLRVVESIPTAVLLVSLTTAGVGAGVGAVAAAVVPGVADVSGVVVDEVIGVIESVGLHTAAGSIGNADIAIGAVGAVGAVGADIIRGSAAT